MFRACKAAQETIRRCFMKFEPKREPVDGKTKEEKAEIEKRYEAELQEWTREWTRLSEILFERTKAGMREYTTMSKINGFREKHEHKKKSTRSIKCP